MKQSVKAASMLVVVAGVFAGGYLVGSIQEEAPIAAPASEVKEPKMNLPALNGQAGEAEVRRIVEAYIKENPQVILQSVQEYQQYGATRQIAQTAQPYRSVLETTEGVPIIGNRDASVKIVEFFDYRCPYCKTGYPVLRRILDEDPDVVLLPKQLPILGDGSDEDISRFAAKAALAAHQQGKFAAMHEGLISSNVPLTKDEVRAIAAGVGLDLAQLEEDMAGDVVEQALAESLSVAEAAGFLQSGTPGYYIGGEVMIGAGADAYERLRAMVDAARAQQATE